MIISGNWDEVVSAPEGHVFVDRIEEGFRFMIIRGPMCLCAYVGVPNDHPLAGLDYDLIPLECHGGLTFGRAGGGHVPKGFFWYGWDYCHFRDFAIYGRPADFVHLHDSDKQWDVPSVEKDSIHALYEFSKFVRLAECISKRAKLHL
jgi:hypothetical protein